MARLSGALTQGLMNPTYSGRLGEAAGMLGGLGGQMLADKAQREQMDKLRQEKDPRARLAIAIQQAKTAPELLAAQQALTQFDQTAKQNARADVLQNREDLTYAQGQVDRDRQEDTSVATAMLGAAGMRYNEAVLAGDTKRADQILKNMETTASRGQGLNIQDFIDTSLLDPAKRAGGANSNASLADRYVRMDDNTVFDRLDLKFITNDAVEEGAPVVELAPKDFLSNISQEQKNNKVYDEKSYQEFLTAIPKVGVYAAANTHLEKTDLARAKAAKRSSAMSDAQEVLNNLDDLIARAPEMDDEATLGNIGTGIKQSIGSFISGTAASALEDDVKVIQAKEAFGSLQTMRENSKTGGALGSVSENELELLKADTAFLNPAGATFKQNLVKIKSKYQRILDIEMGPPAQLEAGGAPIGNYAKGPDGRVFYSDPASGIVYDYTTGDPV